MWLTVITVRQSVVDYWSSALDRPEDHAVSERVRKAARAQTDKVRPRTTRTARWS